MSSQITIQEALSEGVNLWTYDKENQNVKFAYADEILSAYQSAFKRIFPNISVDSSTPQGQLITSLAQTDLATIALLQSFINSFFFGGNGISLDLWAWNLFRIKRKSGTKSQAIIRVSGVANTRIPSDFKVSDSEGHTFTISSPNESIGTSGYSDCLFIADDLSDFQAQPNSLSEIVNSVLGLEQVTNPNIATEPILKESDNELFQRCLNFGALATNASFKSILANVANVNGVLKLNGIENVANVNQTIQGLDLLPHSILLVVKGGEDLEIAEAIQKSRATGCAMNGDVEVEIMLNDVAYAYKFSRPSIVALKCEVTISNKNIIEANYKALASEAIVNYINKLQIGAFITQPNIANSLKNQISGFEIVDLKFSKKDNELGYEAIQLQGNEEAFIATDDITITLSEAQS